LTIDDQIELMSVMQDCLVEASSDFLSLHGMRVDDFDWVLTSQYSSQWIAQYGDRMSISASKLIDLGSDNEGNPSSSSFAVALRDGVRNGTFKSGQLVLVAQVCPGVQTAFATYRV
jgi:3-oxoacyl-[acyl-carrier-protein] synthase III